MDTLFFQEKNRDKSRDFLLSAILEESYSLIKEYADQYLIYKLP